MPKAFLAVLFIQKAHLSVSLLKKQKAMENRCAILTLFLLKRLV